MTQVIQRQYCSRVSGKIGDGTWNVLRTRTLSLVLLLSVSIALFLYVFFPWNSVYGVQIAMHGTCVCISLLYMRATSWVWNHFVLIAREATDSGWLHLNLSPYLTDSWLYGRATLYSLRLCNRKQMESFMWKGWCLYVEDLQMTKDMLSSSYYYMYKLHKRISSGEMNTRSCSRLRVEGGCLWVTRSGPGWRTSG